MNNNTKYNKTAHAFSLVEMLMALLVASLLLAALAPVMTKKMNEKVNFEGIVQNPTRHKVVYLTEPGNGEWEVPNGIRQYKVTTVGAGGGGGAGSNYGCVVFTTTATPSGSLLGKDNEYCEHVRSDNNASFTIPEGVNELYISMISGAGGGGAGSAKWADTVTYDKAGTYTWSVPDIVRGDRILVTMNGGGGGGGGADQGGAGGGASGGYVKPTAFSVSANKTKIQAIVGGGGGGGYYTHTPGTGGSGKPAGEDGVAATSGGGGGGASNFDNDAITAFGGGGGAGQLYGNADGWANMYNYKADFAGGSQILWKTVFNYGGSGRNGGTTGPYGGYGGVTGGIGGAGGGVSTGGNAENGNVGANGAAPSSSRGGKGGVQSASGQGKGGYGQDMWHGTAGSGVSDGVGGGAGGGGGGSYFGAGTNAFTNCSVRVAGDSKLKLYQKANTGAGGAGASCGFNSGTNYGGDGGDGIIKINYLTMNYGGTGGQSGAVVPRSRIALTNTMKSGNVLTITLGRGGKGGDRVIAYPNGNNIEIRTVNSSGAINSTTNLDNTKGAFGTASSVVFNGTNIATTGIGSCGGGYQTGSAHILNCSNNKNCGTRNLNGDCIAAVTGWHGHQSGACRIGEIANHAGTQTLGGMATNLNWDGGLGICGPAGGSLGIGSEFSKRNGLDGSAGLGGSGSYYGGYGGKGGDGYVKIEWGIPRNIDRTEALRYSGGGGSAGETITRNIIVSPITRKIKYTIGEGGIGGSFDSNNLKMTDGTDGGNTTFGNGGNYGFDTITAKGGKGGKSVKITSTYDSYFTITSLTGTNGDGGIACEDDTKCSTSLNGKAGTNNLGGEGGNSNTGTGGKGGSDTNINGLNAPEFNGTTGGGAGGGGGASGNNSYGKGGKGANGYIKIEYDD